MKEKDTMIVQRMTIDVEKGRMEDAVALHRKEQAAESELSGYSGTVRLYVSETGKSDRLAIEWEYEDLAEYAKRWADWRARPTTAAFMEKWYGLVKGWVNEIWNVPD
jgi:hypothetical protein